ncbi:hypothetical protein [Bradyrhizobium sp. SZCCHNR2023]|uniref:hypothetical protein n=1 Tax=Bradyrhizobium sp. SZCCHNR2023 TaxID=3057380 RepID=UPI002916C183|nr:hypothetical protein [Bradyrhizobium sp. SZCCHNR2023]
MFEPPTKGDLDRNLSVIMHDAHHLAMAVRGRIVSEAAAQGALNSRVPFTIGNAIDGIHRDAIEQAMVVVRTFMDRMQLPPKEITSWARPHLENLGNTVLSAIHPAGYPGEHQQALRQYGALFQQRLDGALRDAEIGFVGGAGFAQVRQSATLAATSQPKEVLSLKPGWFGMSIDLKELWRRVSKPNAR